MTEVLGTGNESLVCNYHIGNQTEASVQCAKPARYVVTWPPEMATPAVVCYCGAHYRSVRSYLNQAVEVSEVGDEV